MRLSIPPTPLKCRHVHHHYCHCFSLAITPPPTPLIVEGKSYATTTHLAAKSYAGIVSPSFFISTYLYLSHYSDPPALHLPLRLLTGIVFSSQETVVKFVFPEVNGVLFFGDADFDIPHIDEKNEGFFFCRILSEEVAAFQRL
ncbi:hypothetical protein L1887_20985 [Cichorium endivia]|nr:hypothetical protein L1887_20985 [Cichorium endivia]